MKGYMHLKVLKLPTTHIGCTTFACPPKMYASAFSPYTCHMCVLCIVVCLCKIHGYISHCEISGNFILVKIATHFIFNTLIWLKLNIFVFKYSLFLFLSTICVICLLSCWVVYSTDFFFSEWIMGILYILEN